MSGLPALTENSHPLLTQRGFVIHTRELAELHGRVVEAMNAGTNTLAVYGPPGSGKTTACLELVEAVSEKTPTLSAHLLCRQYQRSVVNINNFWNDLLIALGRTQLGTRKSDAESAVYQHIITECTRLKNKRVFLILDEAQNLPKILLSELKNFHDKLLEQKHYPFFIFVGQIELKDLHKRLVAEGSLDLVRRFFLRWHEFKSPALADLGNILKCYDSEFRFPADGPTFTDHFAPKTFSAGWRLQQEAAQLEEEFSTLAIRYKQAKPKRLEMSIVSAAARHFLIALGNAEKKNTKIDFDAIRKEAVENSGLIEQWLLTKPEQRP